MLNGLRLAVAAGCFSLLTAAIHAAPEPVRMPTPDEIKKIEAAAPTKPRVEPAKPRKALIVGWNEAHLPVPYATEALRILGSRTGAYAPVVSNDPEMFAPENIKQFDVIILNNLHLYDPMLPANFKQLSKEEQAKAKERQRALRESFVNYVKNGGGVVGIHGTTVGLFDWQEFGEIIGGYFADWPWKGTDEVPIKLDEPQHPLNAAFGGKGFSVLDEGYEFKAPYSREKVRVLMSIDLGKTDNRGKRVDKDYAFGWIREYGKGRVFYSAIGHFPELYMRPEILQHYLDGIQYAAGDLKADATPSAKVKK